MTTSIDIDVYRHLIGFRVLTYNVYWNSYAVSNIYTYEFQ